MKKTFSLLALSVFVMMSSHLASAAQISRGGGFGPPAPICPVWGCGGPPIFTPIEFQPALTDGYWGGRDASLQVSDQGATLQLGCEVGIISTQIFLDGNNSFSVNGLLKSGLGAIAIDEAGNPVNDPGNPAVFSGTVVGDTLLLSINGADTYSMQLNAQIGPDVCE